MLLEILELEVNHRGYEICNNLCLWRKTPKNQSSSKEVKAKTVNMKMWIPMLNHRLFLLVLAKLIPNNCNFQLLNPDPCLNKKILMTLKRRKGELSLKNHL